MGEINLALHYQLPNAFMESYGAKPEQKRRSFDNTRREWWLAEHGS
jgi:hypothetical protein